MRTAKFLALLFGLALMAAEHRAALAGGGGSGGICSGFSTGTTIAMRDGCYNGAAQFVKTGATLVVTNEGHAPHSMTAVDGSFDTGLLDPGQTARITVNNEGILQIYCTLHGTINGQGMSGVLIVGNAATGLETATNASVSLAGSPASDEALLGRLDEQTEALASLTTQVTALKQSVDGRPPSVLPLDAGVLGLLGVLLGASALTAVLLRQRAAGLAGEESSSNVTVAG